MSYVVFRPKRNKDNIDKISHDGGRSKNKNFGDDLYRS